MERSAAALKAGGNTLDESLGLLVSGNLIQQDAETTASALKILSLRVRGAKTELESMQESTDGLADSSSKMREEIKALTGVDIMVDDDTFKSTAQMIKELGAVYNQLSDVSQAALLEKIAGKNRASTIEGLLQNYQLIDEVMKSAEQAEGSALRENDKFLESIDGRMAKLSNQAQEFWYKLIDSDTIKDGITLLTQLVETGTDFVDILGNNVNGIVPVITAISGLWMNKKGIGERTMFQWRNCTAPTLLRLHNNAM